MKGCPVSRRGSGHPLFLQTSAEIMLVLPAASPRTLPGVGSFSPLRVWGLMAAVPEHSWAHWTWWGSPSWGLASSLARAAPWLRPGWTQGFVVTLLVSRTTQWEVKWCFSLPGFAIKSPPSRGGQGFSYLVVLESEGSGPPLRNISGSSKHQLSPSASPFHTCWSTLLLWLGTNSFMLPCNLLHSMVYDIRFMV